MLFPFAKKIVTLIPDQWLDGLSKKLVSFYLHRYAKIKVVGLEQLKTIQKPTIFVCNHLSNSDGLVLNNVLKEIDPTFVAGVKLSQDQLTNIGIHAVKTTNIKPNTADKEGIKKIIKLIKQGESLVIFPEGTRSRVGSLIEAKKGILLIGKMTGAPIVPIGIYGTEKLLPINDAGDMGSEKFHHAEVTVQIGETFSLPPIAPGQDRKEYEAFAITYIMKKIAALLPDAYRGVYQ